MRLLIIGRLNGQVGAASQIARKQGAEVVYAEDIATGLTHIRSGKGADVILADVALAIGDLIDRLRGERIAVPVIACGISADARTAVAAIKAGAKDYLPLPPDAELIAAILAAFARDTKQFVHADPAMKAVLDLADRVAASDASVLITGESGTGKEVMARYLHAGSKRASARFVAVNCAAIPEALLESELFGHEKGAFTGAVARRIGRFEEADGGTLLLDEISEMDPRLQAKLLRVLQEREITRVGGTEPIRVDPRILATSNRDLEQAVRDQTFRQDLYYRLNVVTIQLPSLRARPYDIPLLARHFAAKYAAANGLGSVSLTAEAERRLCAYSWPGNVRELENTIHRAVLLVDGDRIGADAIILPPQVQRAASPPAGIGRSTASHVTPAVGQTVSEVERDLILHTLDHCLGNRTHAATVLGISIRTLRNKLKQYAEEGVSVPRPSQA